MMCRVVLPSLSGITCTPLAGSERCLHAQPCEALLLGWADCSNMIF